MRVHVIAIFVLSFLFSFEDLNAQVGINTTVPLVTLDIRSGGSGFSDGLMVPRLSGDDLLSKNDLYSVGLASDTNSTVVYVTSTPNVVTDKTSMISREGYYYYNGTLGKWMNLQHPKFFYMPPISINTMKLGDYQLDLYQIYYNQHINPMAASASSLGKVPVVGKRDLEYYVTYYDQSVFTISDISADGVMNYKINKNATDTTFINIVFVLK